MNKQQPKVIMIVKKPFKRVHGFFPFLAMMILLVGCENPNEATVKGKVTLDGNTLDGVTVVFVAGSKNDAKAAAGSIQPDGSYEIQIGQSGKLQVGEYAVKVSAREAGVPNPEGGPPTPGALITPKHYASTETSKLNFNIRAGENIIDIALVSDPVETAIDEAVDAETAEGVAPPAEETPASEEPAAEAPSEVEPVEEAPVESPEEESAEKVLAE